MPPLRKLVLTGIILAVVTTFFTACGNQDAVSPTSTPTHTSPSQPSPTDTQEPTQTSTATNTPTVQPTETPEPTNTPTATPTQTPTATPTESALSLEDVVMVDEGGFSFQPVSDFAIDVQGSQVGVVSEDDEILLFMITDPSGTGNSLQDMLGNFIEAVSADSGELTASEAYSLTIDGQEGLAVNVTGKFLGDDMEGRMAIVAPDETRIFLAFGLAVNNRWENEGAQVFEAVVDTVSFSTESSTSEENSSTDTNADFPLPVPSGEPATEWNNLPIMPQAIAGDGDSGSYSFTTEATASVVQEFYEVEMEILGWSLLGVGEGENGSIVMIFQNDGAVASISIFALDDGMVYVFLVK